MSIRDLSITKKLVVFGLTVSIISLVIVTLSLLRIGTVEVRRQIIEGNKSVAAASAGIVALPLSLGDPPSEVETYLSKLITGDDILYAAVYVDDKVFATFPPTDSGDDILSQIPKTTPSAGEVVDSRGISITIPIEEENELFRASSPPLFPLADPGRGH